MTSSTAVRLAPESFNKLMTPNTVPFNLIEVMQAEITIDEVGIPNTISIDRATLAVFVKFDERQPVYTPDDPIDKRDGRFDEGEEQNTAEDFADALHKFAVDRIVRRLGEAVKDQCVVR